MEKEGIWGSGEPSSSLQWLDPKLFREMSFLPLRRGLCSRPVPLPLLSPIPPPPALGCVAFGKGKAGRSLVKAGAGRTAAGAAESDVRVFCTVFTGHIQSFTALCSKPHLPLRLATLHLSFIPFGPQLLLLRLSSPGWANLACSHPLLSLPAACPACFGRELSITQRATQSLAHWGPFSGAAVITTAESHCAYIFTSLYRNIQWCFTRL